MPYPPPSIVRRHDGLTLTGSCQCPGLVCQLVVTQEKDGTVLLCFHRTSEHSFRLSATQQAALLPLLRGGGR